MAATPARATSHSAAPSLAASLRETSGLVEPMYMLAQTSAGGDMKTKAWSPARPASNVSSCGTKLDHLRSASVCSNWGEVCSERWGCWKRKDVFTSISSLLLIILCPAVTLLMSTRVQSGSNEVSFLSKYNNIVCKDTADQINGTSFDKAKENLLVSKFMWSNSTPIFPFTSPRHSYRNLIEAVMKVDLNIL